MASGGLDTPMMRQFLSVKAQHPDAVIFYRMGDFYEMFLDDAELVAPILDITLTSRDKGKENPIPMCGVPVHAADAHIKRLAELGHRIAICEQVEDPKEAGGKRLVRREVVEVVTPGLVGDPAGLDGRKVVALAAIHYDPERREFGLATLDASTGNFRATSIPLGAGSPEGGEAKPTEADESAPREFEFEPLPDVLIQELARIGPREILLSEERLARDQEALTEFVPGLAFKAQPKTLRPPTREAEQWFDALSRGGDAGAQAAVTVAGYLAANQPFAIENPPRLRRYEVAESVILDAATRRHLELHENSEDRGRAGTLLAELDSTAAPWVRGGSLTGSHTHCSLRTRLSPAKKRCARSSNRIESEVVCERR